METKRDLEAKAKSLINTNPEEAISIYRNIWDGYPELFNEWDAFFLIKAMRASKTPDLNWANEVVIMHNNDRVGNLYGWLIFDRCVKGKSKNVLIENENFISKLTTLSPQKNLKENDEFPCPTTISIFKLCDAHAENLFNARKINELLFGLDYKKLSDKSKTIGTVERGDVELSSDLEKYFAFKTKALLKIGDYIDCKSYCSRGLELLSKFHYNNDLWFKMRIALAEDKLGNHTISENLFKELLSSKAGNDKWFLYRDIAEVYFEQKDFLKAWKYAIDGSFYGNEPHFLIGLYLLQARILFKLERPLDGKILAELIATILKEQQWSDKAEYNKLFQFYSIDRTALRQLNNVLIEARKFWQNERYGNKSKVKGTIISIHQNGKVGRIKEIQGSIINFHKKNLNLKLKTIESLNGSEVEFFIMDSIDGKKNAENITITKPCLTPKINDLVGKSFEGTVKNVADFGIFFFLKDAPNGLLHRNSLPDNLKNNFRDFFLQGKVVKVKVEKVTEKGIQLLLGQNVV